MTINTNRIFNTLLKELNIDYNTVDITLNDEIETLLRGDIIESNDCVTLSTLSAKTVCDESTVDKIGVQDFSNHFHIDSSLTYGDSNDIHKIVSYGLTTLKRLVKRFKDEKRLGIVYSISIETIELSKKLNIDLGWDDDEPHYIGCRISFYKNPTGETVTDKDLENYKYNAMMTIQT